MNNTTSQKMNRRRFLQLTGAALGVSVAACCGLGTLATIGPDIEFTETQYQGSDQMKQRILVTYASKAGSTGEVADAIGETLASNDTVVDVYPIDQVSDLRNYQAVVLGSAIRARKWISSATGFVEAHQSYLSQIPTAIFTCCMTLHEESEENRQKALAYMTPITDMVDPVAMIAFAGKMDYNQISFFDRTLVKMIGVPEGDFRDWEVIRAWATDLQSKLMT